MKIKIFVIDTSSFPDPGLSNSTPPQHMKIPVLPAYAIDHAFLIVNGVSSLVDNQIVSIVGEDIIYNPQLGGYDIDNEDVCELNIAYHGIRDYSLLFPKIVATEPDRANRLGEFYKEAESCFEQGAWLSFALMSGAIFEHMLHHKLSKKENTLSKLIIAAKQQNLITAQEEDNIEKIRNFRNVIHCNRLTDAYITRSEAMDTKTLIDRLILTL